MTRSMLPFYINASFPSAAFSKGLLCFAHRNFREISFLEKLNCCLNVKNAIALVEGAAQQFQLPCICQEGFQHSGKGALPSSKLILFRAWL